MYALGHKYWQLQALAGFKNTFAGIKIPDYNGFEFIKKYTFLGARSGHCFRWSYRRRYF
ncbi:hypothetical protein D3C85_1336860 [compost metagenome]